MFIPQYLLEKKPLIYFLYYDDVIVYIWETWLWIKRIFQHTNKEYNKVEIIDAPINETDRKTMEFEYINKYKPKYNMSNNISMLLKREWYIQVEKIRSILRKNYENSYKYTNNLKREMRKLTHKTSWSANSTLYVLKNEAIQYFKEKYNLSINL